LIQFNKESILKNTLAAFSSLTLLNSNILSTNTCNQNNNCKCFNCIKSANALEVEKEEWYNPKNERIFDTLHHSNLPAHPELYLPRDLGLSLLFFIIIIV
jgi:hypothetical protein